MIFVVFHVKMEAKNEDSGDKKAIGELTNYKLNTGVCLCLHKMTINLKSFF